MKNILHFNTNALQLIRLWIYIILYIYEKFKCMEECIMRRMCKNMQNIQGRINFIIFRGWQRSLCKFYSTNYVYKSMNTNFKDPQLSNAIVRNDSKLTVFQSICKISSNRLYQTAMNPDYSNLIRNTVHTCSFIPVDPYSFTRCKPNLWENSRLASPGRRFVTSRLSNTRTKNVT